MLDIYMHQLKRKKFDIHPYKKTQFGSICKIHSMNNKLEQVLGTFKSYLFPRDCFSHPLVYV